jgi:hypothetical protein
VTWSATGRRWLVDDRPWLDEFRWSEVLNRARAIRVRQERRRPGDPAVCETCADDAQLFSRDADRRIYTIPCPTCRPAAYRHAIGKEEAGG